jgi:hypothetical protein
MNLILNGEPTALRDNVLMDRPEEWPGHTHAAFIVERLSETLDWAVRKNVTIYGRKRRNHSDRRLTPWHDTHWNSHHH